MIIEEHVIQDEKKMQELDQLLQISENEQCFECWSASEKWVSVNNGIFLCKPCADKHRQFGIKVSCIRSLENDHWDERNLRALILGGNQKLRLHLQSFGLLVQKSNNLSIKQMQAKYLTRAGVYYRENLKCLVEGTILPDRVPIQKGLEQCEEYVEGAGYAQIQTMESSKDQDNDISQQKTFHLEPQSNNDNFIQQQQQSGVRKFSAKLKQGFKSATQKTKLAFKDLNQKVKNSKFDEDIKQFGQKTKHVSKVAYNDVKMFFKRKFKPSEKHAQIDINNQYQELPNSNEGQIVISDQDVQKEDLQKHQYQNLNEEKSQTENSNDNYEVQQFEQKQCDQIKQQIQLSQIQEEQKLQEPVEPKNFKQKIEKLGDKFQQRASKLAHDANVTAKEGFQSISSKFGKWKRKIQQKF